MMSGPVEFLSGPFDDITAEGGLKGATKGAAVGVVIGAGWLGALVIGGATVTGGPLGTAAALAVIGAMRGAMRKKPR